LRLRYKSFASCISVTFLYSALECAHSIKLYIHTHTQNVRHPPLFNFLLFPTLFLSVSFRKWIRCLNGSKTKTKYGLCYVLAVRSPDVTEIISFLSILPPDSHRKFQKLGVIATHSDVMTNGRVDGTSSKNSALHFQFTSKWPSSKPHWATRQQAIAETPAKWSAYQIPSVIVVFVILVCKFYFQKPKEALNLLVTEERYWALFYMPLVTEERYWALFYMPLVTEERYWALFYMPLYTFIHSVLNVLVQIANKMRFQKQSHSVMWECYHLLA
jgi:hypothetical protein